MPSRVCRFDSGRPLRGAPRRARGLALGGGRSVFVFEVLCGRRLTVRTAVSQIVNAGSIPVARATFSATGSRLRPVALLRASSKGKDCGLSRREYRFESGCPCRSRRELRPGPLGGRAVCKSVRPGSIPGRVSRVVSPRPDGFIRRQSSKLVGQVRLLAGGPQSSFFASFFASFFSSSPPVLRDVQAPVF